ncbi:MAG: hypothetical protein HOP08_00690 [Cyclobacteriaceae bacterium]|nr:hypothetical protein [Cyclobacteriaceae bacterium]
MDNELEDKWKRRILNQQFPLIGSNLPGEGNGYHDRVSFDLNYNQSTNSDDRYNHWVYFVYFRDLINSFDPELRQRFHENVNFDLINCSENYRDTFKRYIAGQKYHYQGEILDAFSTLLKLLIQHGRIILEFVSWFDNETSDVYGFELKILPFKNTIIRNKNVQFEGIDRDGTTRKVKIPKNKCIVIDWPKKLGGYKGFSETINKVLSLGPKTPPISDVATLNPGTILARNKKWEEEFNRLLAKWGLTSVPNDLTEFYKEYNNLKIRSTGILCIEAILVGLNQVVQKLNIVLGEQASLVETSDFYCSVKHEKITQQWLNGTISFTTANSHLR